MINGPAVPALQPLDPRCVATQISRSNRWYSTLPQPWSPPWISHLPIGAKFRLERHGRRLQAMTNEAIDTACPGSLIHTISQDLTSKELHHEVMTLFTGASDTTSTTSAWMLLELGRNPAIQHRVREEVTGVLKGRIVDTADFPRLPYTEAVINETLRRRTVTWILMRKAIDDGHLGDVVIPAGSDVFFSPELTHMNPDIFPEPERFDPDRWENNPPTADTFLPFSGGIHKCVGFHFANLQMYSLLAELLPRWEFHTTNDKSADLTACHPTPPDANCPSTQYVATSNTRSASGNNNMVNYRQVEPADVCHSSNDV